MKIVVLDAETLGEDLSLEPLRELGEVVAYPLSTPEEILERVVDCDVLMQNKAKITAEVFAAAKKLRLICEAATGYDNIDLEAARRHGVAVCNVPGYSTASVAQLTVSMVLSLATRLPAYAAHVASGAYSEGGHPTSLTPVYHELAGRTWGIVGYGNIGRAVADVARALGCRVLTCRRAPDASEECVDIDTLCREADVITLHTPLTEATRHLIDARRLSLMKDGVILVNVARGAVTDEAAVAEAYRSGKLGGLGVDVFSVEPMPKTHPYYPLREEERVLLTPHMAWGSFEARTRCLLTMLENAKSFFAGGRLNRID